MPQYTEHNRTYYRDQDTQSITQAKVAEDSDGTFSVWVWYPGSHGEQHQAGMTEADAHTLAGSLVS